MHSRARARSSSRVPAAAAPGAAAGVGRARARPPGGGKGSRGLEVPVRRAGRGLTAKGWSILAHVINHAMMQDLRRPEYSPARLRHKKREPEEIC